MHHFFVLCTLALPSLVAIRYKWQQEVFPEVEKSNKLLNFVVIPKKNFLTGFHGYNEEFCLNNIIISAVQPKRSCRHI
jgi:hypothetical protein